MKSGAHRCGLLENCCPARVCTDPLFEGFSVLAPAPLHDLAVSFLDPAYTEMDALEDAARAARVEPASGEIHAPLAELERARQVLLVWPGAEPPAGEEPEQIADGAPTP